jgi:hypothetical protein
VRADQVERADPDRVSPSGKASFDTLTPKTDFSKEEDRQIKGFSASC